MSPPQLSECLRFGPVRLCEDASIRTIGEGRNATLAAFKGDENVTFLLRPEREENLLYQALRERRELSQVPDGAISAATRLVLDGVLAIRNGARWVTVADSDVLLPDFAAEHACADRHAHLLAGRLLRASEVGPLAHWLYTSGRWPGNFASTEAARRSLSALGVFECPEPWERIPLGASPAWIAWNRRTARASNPTGLPRVKLYVSVPPRFFERHHPALLATIFASEKSHEVKIAATASGLHRADAVVVYGEDHRHLAALARRLSGLLPEAPPSGMTFAAGFPETHNLFWGIDPLLPEHLIYGDSWRRFLCTRCARIAARLWEGCPADPLVVARTTLFRISLDGIDITNWIPPYASPTI